MRRDGSTQETGKYLLGPQECRRGGVGGRTIQEKPCLNRPLARALGREAAGRSLRRLYRFVDLPSSRAAAASRETPTASVAIVRPLTKGHSSLLTPRSASASVREFGGWRCSGWSRLACLSVSVPEKEILSQSQDSCLEHPMDRGTWWAVVHGVTKSQT